MRTKIATLALAGTLGRTGTALLAPGSALAQTADGTPRLTALKDALAGLVGDGTLTQGQADKVAKTLDNALPGPRHRGPGGRGPVDGPRGAAHVAREEVAKALGITVDELRAQREAGTALAQIAATKGISKDTLISRLMSAATSRLATAVTEGRLTQAQADAMATGLRARITDQVDRVGPGPRGPGRHHDGPDGDAPAARSASPSPSPATSS